MLRRAIVQPIIVKGIAISLVILGHDELFSKGDRILNLVSGFHRHSFVIASGILHGQKSDGGLKL